MGYWTTAPSGSSFDEDGPLMWGDAPADAMAEGFDDAVFAFTRDLGRLPTVAEVVAGVLFHLPVTGLPFEPDPEAEWATYQDGDWAVASGNATALCGAALARAMEVDDREAVAQRDDAVAATLTAAAAALTARAARLRGATS